MSITSTYSSPSTNKTDTRCGKVQESSDSTHLIRDVFGAYRHQKQSCGTCGQTVTVMMDFCSWTGLHRLDPTVEKQFEEWSDGWMSHLHPGLTLKTGERGDASLKNSSSFSMLWRTQDMSVRRN